jgi:1-deoxy-D-xylulose-5-phosphate reductoisomerase
VGTQALEVVRNFPGLFGVEVLTAQSNSAALIRQAMEFLPNAVVIGNDTCYAEVTEALKKYPVKVFAGMDALAQVVAMDSIDLVLNALVGYPGLRPTLSALAAGKNIALANKETLVIAGEMIMETARRTGVRILPVDSEHSAIFQCLAGEHPLSVEKIYLTASGGPFRGSTRKHLEGVNKESALAHPNWKMGKKITIDSATLMNKGLEVIEARWLFNVEPHLIDVVIHPQSVIHSMVQFVDGSIKAQMGLPDMKLPILYAMTFPLRIPTAFPRFSFLDYPALTFEQPDKEVFRSLGLAYEALHRGGNIPCALNAANEAAVHAFLEDRISFLAISRVIEGCMGRIGFVGRPGIDDFIATHEESVAIAGELIRENQR